MIWIRDRVDDLPRNNKEFTERDYRGLRGGETCPYKGYAGLAFSYGGKWMGGWRRDRQGMRDYVREAFDNAKKQSVRLQGVRLMASDYRDLYIPKRSLIYCDPPYKGTTGYKYGFDTDSFWVWCRERAKEGHTVFVSEYDAPDDFDCVYKKEITSSLTADTGSKRSTEKLFVPRLS